MVEKARGRQAFMYDQRVIYEWEQSIDEVHVYIKPPEGVTKHHLDIKLEPRKVSVGLKGNPPFLSEELSSLADSSCSFWMLEDGELHIQLGKVKKAETWPSAFKNHGGLDAFSQQEVQKKLMLERFQEEHPGFDFSGASFSGQAPDARTFMGGVKYN
uniref:CS domain-containing protein n=1 Tax=Chromera velia CCMP2878 TaxID=1169474 RepID=A0A0G4FK65_9ALVE|eukprot:Cvel_3437.t1-p1 / transcript=Cvel_3437.t1 / gene=Cvel_3437 / organism=Chromera_velia_CCMP2878 / gene_product=NudC domain-containing protein 2, putative / transcript_product=NudC domain-containing protein 2, putative / location=Cvel_scaffold138:76652-77119(-) / protein_length=156 / sequence_SO=supercontig / SO=protein_coding / is_pseudo=false